MTETKLNSYTPEEKENNLILFRGWMRENGGSKKIADSPAFRRSVHDLVHVHGYSPTEISEWLGISRAWMVKLMEFAGIPRPGLVSRYRYWDGEGFKNSPLSPTSFVRDRQNTARRLLRAEEQRHIYEYRRVYGVFLIKEFVDRTGRVPYVRELMSQLGMENHQAPALAHRMGHDACGLVSKFFDDIWRQAGFQRPDGRSSKFKQITGA